MFLLWAIVPTIIVFALVTGNRGYPMVCAWNIVGHAQIARWLPLLDLKPPPYYTLFTQELHKAFDYTEIWPTFESHGDPPNYDHLPNYGIPTTLYLANGEEWLLVWSVALPV
jgi:hypothetical protein